MLKKENIHQDYTTYSAGYQLSLTMDIQVYIAPRDPVRLLNQLLEGLDYEKLLSLQKSGIGSNKNHGFGQVSICNKFHVENIR